MTREEDTSVGMQFIYTKPLKYQFRLNIFDGDKKIVVIWISDH